jgi:small subunit ribosomal protein S17e|eukprot:COSAG02_NODE_3621_length_6458_cov_23.823243_8_plen_58_part_00
MVEKYYSRLTVDFQVNKRVCEEIAIIPTKRLRNKIAGYITVRCLFHFACACGCASPS